MAVCAFQNIASVNNAWSDCNPSSKDWTVQFTKPFAQPFRCLKRILFLLESFFDQHLIFFFCSKVYHFIASVLFFLFDHFNAFDRAYLRAYSAALAKIKIRFGSFSFFLRDCHIRAMLPALHALGAFFLMPYGP